MLPILTIFDVARISPFEPSDELFGHRCPVDQLHRVDGAAPDLDRRRISALREIILTFVP